MTTYAAYHVLHGGVDPSGAFLTGIGSAENQLKDIYEKETGHRPSAINPFTGRPIPDPYRKTKPIEKPGFGESLIPIWGSGKSSAYHLQEGNYWTAGGYAVLAITDIFLVKALVTSGCKVVATGGWKALWPAWGKWGYLTGLNKPHFYWEVLKKGWHAWDEAIAAMTRAEIRYFVGLKRYWIPMIYLSRGLATIEGAGKNCLIAMYNSTSRSWYRLDYFIITRLLGDMVAPESEDGASNEDGVDGHEAETHGSYPGWRPSGGAGYIPR